jgi:regulator of sigma E protease
MNILIGLISLSFVVFAHELGHFVAAKLSGIEVERFSIGIGKRLFGFKRGKTDYCLSLLPIGGFCKMKGEDSFQKALGRGEEMIVGEPGSFYAANPFKRIFVAVMGPFFNFLFSIIALSILWTMGFAIRGPSNRILLSSSFQGETAVASTGENPADAAGLKNGDRILAVDGTDTPFFFQVREEIAKRGGKSAILRVERNGESRDIGIRPWLDPVTREGRIGIYPWVEPVVASVSRNGPAARAGLKKGDRIVSVGGASVNSSMALSKIMDSRPSSLDLVALGESGERRLALYPDYDSRGNPNLGFEFHSDTYHSPRVGFFGGIARGFNETVGNLAGIVKSLGLLFRKFDITESVAGTARIVFMVGDATVEGFSSGIRDGIASSLKILSLISLSLLVTNLLPIPVLDGGLIVVFLIEAIRRKPLKARTLYRITMAGFAVVAAIFLFSLFSDILYFTFKR